MSSSKRQMMYGRMIQKELGVMFTNELRGRFGKTMVTVSQVIMSPDLGLAKVYLSLLLADNKEELVESVVEMTPEIRGILGRRISKQVRAIPALRFYYDDTLDEVDKIDKLFKDITITPAPGDKEE